jgi:hypothetical protein
MAIYFIVAVPVGLLLKHHYDPWIALGFLVLWAFAIMGLMEEETK